MKETNIEALRRRLEAERAARKNGGRNLFSDALRAEVVALLEHPDWGPTKVKQALKLSNSLLYRWRREARASGTPQMKRVTVTETPSSPASQLTLELPNGARVYGLTLPDVVTLMWGKR